MVDSMKKRRIAKLESKLISQKAYWEAEKNRLFKDIKPSIQKGEGSSSPLVQAIMDINVFYVKNQRVPSIYGDFEEKKLARRLASLKSHTDNDELHAADVHGLLSGESTDEVKDALVAQSKAAIKLDKSNDDTLAKSILDVFGQGLRGKLLDTSSLKANAKNTSERLGKRLPCPDFHRYVHVFTRIKAMIDNRQAVIEPFKGKGANITLGEVFIWDGITCFVSEEVRMEYDPNGKPNPRLRVIFDNGTYADLLQQSLSQGMYRSNGTRRLSQSVAKYLGDLAKPLEKKYGVKTGEIYFLGTHSKQSFVSQYNSLIKIGVTTSTTPKRTNNAVHESTYLYAPIKILKILPCYNMDVMGLEELIHAALNEYRKQITIVDKLKHTKVTATEWFDVPLHVAVETALSIVRGNYSNVELDAQDNLHQG
jgi:hypothetical protein